MSETPQDGSAPEQNASAPNPEERLNAYELSAELADSYKVLIDNSWRQYEVTLLRLPDQYSGKAKQYLWMISLLLAVKIQIVMKFPGSLYNLYCSGNSVQVVAFWVFVFSGVFDLCCFALGIRFLNADTMTTMPLGTPYKTFEENYQSSYKMFSAILSEIHHGLESAQIRLKTAGENLNRLGIATAVSVGLTLILLITVPNKDFIEEHRNEQQRHSTSAAPTDF